MDLKGFHILIADDDEYIRKKLSLQLEAFGCTVTEAEDGSQALAILENQSFDLVLLDIVMPKSSGLDVLANIRQTRSMIELPVIMISALNESYDITHAMSLGANDYIAKSADWRVAYARIQTHLGMRRLTEQNKQFLRIATHDLKKPLMIIKDVMAVTQDEVAQGAIDDAKLKENFSIIEASVNTMQGFIADFLELDAIENGKIKLSLSDTDINLLIRQVALQNQGYAEKKQIQLALDLAPQLPAIMADEARLLQVIDNIVDNALKFSPANTCVQVHSFARDGWVTVEVSDEGPGFTSDGLNKAFRKFSQLGNVPTGNESSTGLGLAICKQLVEAQNGEIGLRNNPGGGATFHFRLLANKN